MSNDHTHTLKIKCADDFDLEKTISNKPFLFFYDDSFSRGFVLNHKKVLAKFSQKGRMLMVELCSSRKLTLAEMEFLKKRLIFCLGCQESLDKFYVLVENDPVLMKYYDKIYGSRVLSAFDEFEALVSIVCSQNTTFPNYRGLVNNLIELFGGGEYFPTPAEILENEEKLDFARVGYRRGFIRELAKFFFKRGRFYIPEETELRRIKGIGAYSVNIYYLIQQRRYERFYFDRLIKNIFEQRYDHVCESEADAYRFARKRFDGYAGLAELYLQMFLNPRK